LQSFKQGVLWMLAGLASVPGQLPCHKFERLRTVHCALSTQAPSCPCDTTAALVLPGLLA
jgi:hypothetical protein